MAADEGRAALEAQARLLTRRLRLLEIRKARQGDASETSLDLDIEDLRLSIAELRRHIDGPQLLSEARQAIKDYYQDNLDFVINQVAQLNQRQSVTEEKMTRFEQGQHAAQIERLQTKEDVAEIKTRLLGSERQRRLWQPVYAAMFALAMLAIVLGVWFGRIFLW